MRRCKVGVKENPKKHNLIPVLEAFPERKFVIVGDSTELDAEIYVDLYQGKNFPSKFQAPANGYADKSRRSTFVMSTTAKSARRQKMRSTALTTPTSQDFLIPIDRTSWRKRFLFSRPFNSKVRLPG